MRNLPIQILKNKKVNQKLLIEQFVDFVPQIGRDLSLPFYLARADFHYRRYLKGTAKTLHQVFFSIKRLDKQLLEDVVPQLRSIGKIAEDNEFYELIVRHNKAMKKIIMLINKLQHEETNSLAIS